MQAVQNYQLWNYTVFSGMPESVVIYPKRECLNRSVSHQMPLLRDLKNMEMPEFKSSVCLKQHKKLVS